MLYLRITAVHKDGSLVLLQKPILETIERMASLIGVPEGSRFEVDIVNTKESNGNEEERLGHVEVARL